MRGTPHFTPWSEDPDPPDYWGDDDYARMRRRLRRFFDGDLSVQDALVRLRDRRGWDESLHPRDEEGKFTSGGGGLLSGTRARVSDEQQQKFYEAIEDAPVTEGIEAAEENWRGGIADFGDPTAALDVQAMEGYFDYRSHLEEAARENLGEEFPVYRLMKREQLEDWQNGADIDPIATSLNPEFSEKFANFAAFDKTKAQDRILVRIMATPASIVMRGAREESEIVINPNEISGDTLVEVPRSLPSSDPIAEAMTREEIKRHNELEEKYETLNELERQEFGELEKKFELRWKLHNEKLEAERTAKEEAWRADNLKKLANQVAKDLDFDPSRIDIVAGTREFEVNGVKHTAAGDADIYNKKYPGRIRLYKDHLDGSNVAGVTAHEIEHFKFEDALKAYREDSAKMKADPGPAPDPTHERWWGKRGGTSAMMTPDGALRPPYDKKYPYYTALHEALYAPPMGDFADGDGVSKYSAEYWQGWKGGQINTEIALHETLAEMAKAKYLTGKFPEHFGYSPIISERKQAAPADAPDYVEKLGNKTRGTKVWRNLFRTVDRIYKQRSKKQ